jgi:acetolactate synthase-1/2/3 large subunit
VQRAEHDERAASVKEIDGAKQLCEALEALGVECVFGLPGTQNVVLYEALRRSRIRSVVATHELAASFMANGYYRASGRIAPLVTIPGPGFTFALTGVAEALHDSAAVVHFTGRPEVSQRRFQFQALDQRSIAAPLFKGVRCIVRADEVQEAVAGAFELALGGEPGPVLVELSDLALRGASAPLAARSRLGTASNVPLDGAAIDTAGAFLAASRRPVIMAGQGCLDAADHLRQLVELLRAPVFTTLSGRGVVPEDHPLALGFEFVRGDVRALNDLLRRSDCVLVLGCKLTFAGTSGFTLDLPADRLVHVDASADVLGATYQGRMSIVGAIEAVLARLVPLVRRLREPRTTSGDTWNWDEVGQWRQRLRSIAMTDPEPTIQGVKPATAASFFAALRRALPRDAIVVADSGLHQTLLRRHFEVLAPRGLIAPSDFQSMGFGLPAAIGAKLAAPDRVVVVVLGDGGFGMSGLELLTVLREKVPLAVIVFNDGQLNRIRLQQLAQFGFSESCDVQNPDFATFAEAIGVRYARCDSDIEGVLRAAVRDARPTLIEVFVGDSPGIHLSRAKGLVRGAARRLLKPRALAWLRGRIHGLKSGKGFRRAREL